MWQKTFEAAAYLAVALAGGSFEASPVCHRDAASVLPDQPFFVERSYDPTDGGALGTSDLGNELMRKR
jgi:hypothetical protein